MPTKIHVSGIAKSFATEQGQLQVLEDISLDVADGADDDHAGDHQVVAVAGIARIHDEVPQARAQRDHFGRHDH